ncbi:mariner Mos1 transposase [Trichonephila clavipes]|nr:mariner Mos1 transposase [Trichonephila clavipes]
MLSLKQRGNIRFCVLQEKSPEKRSRCRRKHTETIPGPEDFYLFPWLKMKLKDNFFVDSNEVIQNGTKQLKVISKNGFHEFFGQLYERWNKCVDAGGQYPEI